MKILINIILLLFAISLIGCRKQKDTSNNTLSRIEKLIEENPDSASILLNNISPDSLNNKLFAYWCMLSGKITDKVYTRILPTDQLKQACDWYASHGTPMEKAQIQTYLARSYTNEGDYEKAMQTYTTALNIAENNNLHAYIGFIHSYIGDLYGNSSMQMPAINKYKTAARYFKKEKNINSYACALRDIGREYALMDSLESALNVLSIADSITRKSKKEDVKASIQNSLGNIYLLKGEYEKAKYHFLKALESPHNQLPNYVALVELYIKTDSMHKAKAILQKIPINNSEYRYSIKNLNYQICKYEKNYKEALANLEEYTEIIDSLAYPESQSRILDIENKYNHLKIKQEVTELKIKQQKVVIYSIFCTLILLLVTWGYLLYRRKVREKIAKQQAELSNIKIELLNLSLELTTKKNLLTTFNEKNENYNKMQDEIAILGTNYRKLQNKIVLDSPSYKELRSLATQNIPRNSEILITEERWKQIKIEITTIYPNLYNYVYTLCPDLSELDFQYCCFYIYKFDTNEEAKLLNISPDSVRKKHLRLRQRLNISLPAKTTLHEYLTENMN